MSDPGDEPFLSRWSRRKRAGEPEEMADPAAQTPEPEPAAAPPAPNETDEEILARLELPDPDTLEKGDDFSRFMSAAVPEHLRRRALRRLWRSNPALVVLDGLNEYDDDYTKGFVPAGTLKTAYKVGRGLVARMEEEARDEEPETPAPEAVATNAPDNITQESDPPPEDTPDAVEEEAHETQVAQDLTEPDTRPTRRRMQFRVAPKD